MDVNRSHIQGLCGLNGFESPVLGGLPDELAETITHARREYLAEIYRLRVASDDPVTTTALATQLSVSPPAVARMVQRLAREGYVQRKPYKGVSLTLEGEREALKAIRRHRLLEAFLVTVMKFGWDEVHDHAHALEGVINEVFEDRMDELAGHPARCPHGDPIPTKDGQMPAITDQPLSDAPLGAPLIIRRVKTDDGATLRHFAEVGLVPGAAITIANRVPVNGTLRLRVMRPTGPLDHILGIELAQSLRVEVVSNISRQRPRAGGQAE